MDLRSRFPPRPLRGLRIECMGMRRVNLMNLKSAPEGQDFRFSRFMRISGWPAANASNESKVGPKAGT